MADGGDADCLVAVCELVDDPVGADPQRVKATKPATQRIAGVRFTFEQRKCFLGSVYEGQVKFEQLCAGSAREYQTRHWLSRSSFLSQLAAQLAELNRLSPRELIEARL